MSVFTEIYICKDGQKLKEGKLEYRAQVENKDKADAKRRCSQGAIIAKIAYYKVSPTGQFAKFFIFENPEVERRKLQAAGGGVRARGRAKKRTRQTHPCGPGFSTFSGT